MKGEDTDREQFVTRVVDLLGYERYSELMYAYQSFKAFHRGDPRADGSRYVTHPRAAAEILMDFGPSSIDEVVTSLLHDVLEDKFVLPGMFLRLFNGQVERALITLSKYDVVLREKGRIDKIELSDDDAVYYARIAQADQLTRRVKLADRLHNCRTMLAMMPDKRRKKVAETRALVVPIAYATDERLAKAIEEQCAFLESWTH